MTSKTLLKLSPILLAAGLFIGIPLVGTTQSLTPIEELGKLLFFDQKLSIRNNQSCASCHAATSGWTGPIPGINLKGAVYFGSIRTEFGNRKPPSSAYATTSPIFDYDPAEDLFFGGNFWDGRATGWDLGNPAADQARGPFLNPVEQALPNKAAVVKKVCSSRYAGLFRQVWGNEICKDVNAAYDKIALSIEAYEDSIEVNQFSSKYDWVKADKAKFTPQEQWGFDLFETKGKCALCHVVDFSNKTKKDLFTDYTFDNLGIPKNPLNPFYQADPDFVDYGLGDFLRSLAGDGSWRSALFVSYEMKQMDDDRLSALALKNDGKHKVPTLRNVGQRPGPGFVKAYGHNGYFKSLKGIVNFYNTRDVKPVCPGPYTEKEALAAGCWPAPEVAANMNTDELGKLDLSDEEEDAIVAFMATISDGYKPKRK